MKIFETLLVASIAVAIGLPGYAQTSTAPQNSSGRSSQASTPPPQGSTTSNQRSVATTSSSTANGTTKPGTTSARADRGKGGTMSDQAFLKEAAEGGMKEVELGKLAQDKASSDQVRKFANTIVNDHGKMNDQVKDVAKQSKVDISDAAKSTKWQNEKVKLSKLSGANFDKQYMTEMLRDHKHDVEVFQREAKNASNDAVKQFAAQNLPKLQQHLQLAEETYRSVTGEEPSKTVQGLRNPSPPADMNQQGAPQKGASKTGGASGTVSGSARSSGTSGSVSGPISRSKSGSGSIPRNQ